MKLFTGFLIVLLGALALALNGADHDAKPKAAAFGGGAVTKVAVLAGSGPPVRSDLNLDAVLIEAGRLCSDDANVQRAVDACLLQAALVDDPEVFGKALQRGAARQREPDPEAADAMLLLAAASGHLPALIDFGAATPADAGDALVRREALLAAEALGAEPATAALKVYRQQFIGQSLERPDVIIALSEGRGHQIARTMSSHRYLAGLADGLMSSCVWNAAVWDGASMRRSVDVFVAPLRANAHTRLVNTVGESAGRAARAVVRFAKGLAGGEPYESAGADFLREARTVQRSLTFAASHGSESGARDGVRLSELQGCATADALRFVRALKSTFDQRANVTPDPDLPGHTP